MQVLVATRRVVPAPPGEKLPVRIVKLFPWVQNSRVGGTSCDHRGFVSCATFAVAAVVRRMQHRREVSRRIATQNVETVKHLEPAPLWKYFAEISDIPRPSKQEAAILEYIKQFADVRGLRWQQDEIGNLLVHRPGSGGGEQADPVMLQGHVDMVCEKNAHTQHDFNSDPIQLQVDDKWLRATGTTLGADNGIGVAAALAVLDMNAEVKLPPIEALFTVDEETGLTGAFGLDGAMIRARCLLNLDTEEFGSVYIGCAGGGNSTLTIRASRSSMEGGMVPLKIGVTGLLGGHSGINIHEGRGNAVQMTGLIAAAVLSSSTSARLVAIEGGDKHNAIPREAHATVMLPKDEITKVQGAIASCERALRDEFGVLETKMAISVVAEEEAENKHLAFSPDDASRILATLRALPHGVIKMSHALEGLVETSNNVASIKTSDVGVALTLSTRSFLGNALESTRDRLQAIADLSGGTLDRRPAYPGWAPQPGSPLVDLTVRKLGARSQMEPKILAIHAGLECGLLLEKCSTISEAVSFGPTITGAHSPDEALEIETVKPFFLALLDILEHLANSSTASRL